MSIPDQPNAELAAEIMTMRKRLAETEEENRRLQQAIQGTSMIGNVNSEQFLSIIMDNMVDMVNMLDANGVFNFVSPSHERILGYKAAEMIGTNAFEYLHPEDRERVVYSFINSLTTGIAHGTFRFRHRDGSYVWLEASSNLTCDSEGLFAGVVVGGKDITKRKEAVGTMAGGIQPLYSETAPLPGAGRCDPGCPRQAEVSLTPFFALQISRRSIRIDAHEEPKKGANRH